MFSRIGIAIMCCAAALAVAGAASGQSSSLKSAAEAQVLLARAVRELNSSPSAAIAAFNSPSGGFRSGELYVFCFEMSTGQITAHTNRWLLGTKITANGETSSAAGNKILAAAKSGQFTRLSYDAPRPGATESVPKVSYVTRVGEQGCGVGYYPSLAASTSR